MRRIGVLMNLASHDAQGQLRLTAFVQALQQLGWNEGNTRIDVRWGAGEAEAYRKYAAELVSLTPDVILAAAGGTMPALLHATRTVPIVFTQVPDPVGGGFVSSLAEPGGNATGFTPFEYGMGGKWLELLKEIVPGLSRAGVLRDPIDPAGTGQWGAIQSAAPSLGVEVNPINVNDPGQIERGIAGFARTANRGLIVTGSAPTSAHRELIIDLAARHRLPTVYPYRFFAPLGGLIAYGPEIIEQFRRAARYVDRILKGEKPANLPVLAPTKYELVINLKTAKALGIEIPSAVLARADEVIE
jgi:putative ABC transport system substrate-binding protein